MVGFTRALARVVGEYGITMNAVAPGFTSTGYNETVTLPGRFEKAASERFFKRQELPKDIIGMVLFLAFSYSDFSTGELLNVGGGAS